MEQKQTAVEWLISQLNIQGFAEVVTDEEIQKAKEMEKQQIKNSYHSGTIDGFNFRTKSILTLAPNSEQYYNEEYGK